MDGNPSKEEFFQELINRFAQFIHNQIIRYNLSRFGLDAEDIAQEVRLKIWKIVNEERPIQNYASYIKKIVDSSVIDQLRKCRRDEGLLLVEKQNVISEVQIGYWTRSPEGGLLHLLIGKAVESLLDSRRKAVRLYLLNMTIEEIAEFYGWSQDKTRNLLYRGLTDLKTKLAQRDITHEDR